MGWQVHHQKFLSGSQNRVFPILQDFSGSFVARFLKFLVVLVSLIISLLVPPCLCHCGVATL